MLLSLAVLLALATAAVFARGVPPNALACFSVARLRALLPGRAPLAAALPLSVRGAFLLALLAGVPVQVRPTACFHPWPLCT